MSGEPLVRRWTRPARVRGALDDVALGLPMVLAAAALAGRCAGWRVGLATAAMALALLAAAATWRSRRFGRAWLVARLNAARADLEDSADLLLADDRALGPLQRLQRARVMARLAETPPDLRPAASARRLAAAWAAGLVAIAAILLWPGAPPPPALAPSAEGIAAVPDVPRLVGQRLTVTPPGYTGLPTRELTTLDASAPQGSRLSWTLAFDPEPAAATLALLDGRRVPLVRQGARWHVSLPLDRSALYRVIPAGATAPARLHRLEAIADRPPQVTAQTPTRTLTIAAPGQRAWPLAFVASDDYGVSPVAELRLTVAAGDGEQVSFHERTLRLAGSGPPRARRFAAALDLAALGFTGPGDLVAQLTVTDRRAPGPQATRSASLILRRLAPRAGQGVGLDAAVHTALPTALRSQRQVIIDAQALLAQRRSLPADRFQARAQAIGGDQHALRMRYGDLLGQETENAAALPTADAPANGQPATAPTLMGREEDVLGSFGQEHEAETATLFDPETRTRLKGAVDAMWQSELALNQGDPARALPFANRALVLVKQVQQATRIFVAHVSAPQLPAIDETRRLTGKRDDLSPNDLALPPRAADEQAAARAWAAVDGLGGGDLAVAERWARSGGAPLALAAALDAVRRAPACEACRARLRALVWARLPRPPPGAGRRPAADAAGRRYLQAIAP